MAKPAGAYHAGAGCHPDRLAISFATEWRISALTVNAVAMGELTTTSSLVLFIHLVVVSLCKALLPVTSNYITAHDTLNHCHQSGSYRIFHSAELEQKSSQANLPARTPSQDTSPPLS